MEPDLNKEVESFPQRDLERIGEAVERLKNTPEFKSAKPREIVRESIKQVFPQVAPTTGPGQAITDHDEDNLLPNYMQNDTEEDKDEVEALIHLAFTHGIEVSIVAARRRRARILDDLHDALVDKVMPQLEKQNKI